MGNAVSNTVELGNPNGASWTMPVVPDRFIQVIGRDVTFQSTIISEGHSGGALLNEWGQLVGMIKQDKPPFGVAVAFDAILDRLRTWGYPVQLLRSAYDFSVPALHLAAQTGDTQTVQRLLDDGCADVNTKDWRGMAPLIDAVIAVKPESVKVLLQASADVNPPDIGGSGPLASAALMAARTYKEEQVEIFKMLLATGIHERDLTTALETTLRGGIWGDISWNAISPTWIPRIEVIKLLLAAGAKPVALDVAMKRGYSATVDLLLKHGADINGKYERGETMLHGTVAHGQVEKVKLLLKSGASPNVPGDTGRTPFHHTVDGWGLRAYPIRASAACNRAAS
jgi:hypothetical protein